MCREAKCSYCGTIRKSDDPNLPFFEDLSSSSEKAQITCKHCGYFKCAHEKEGVKNNVIKTTVVEDGKCPGFEPVGEYKYDRFYCGCRGWE